MTALNFVIFRDLALKEPAFVYDSLTVNIWKITPIRADVEGAGVNLGSVK